MHKYSSRWLNCQRQQERLRWDLSHGWEQSPSCLGKAGTLLTSCNWMFWDGDLDAVLLSCH